MVLFSWLIKHDFRCKLLSEVSKAKGSQTSKVQADLQRKHNILYQKTTQWREIQVAYMPSIAALLLKSGAIILHPDDNSIVPDLTELIPLYLPSSFPPGFQLSPMLSPLADKKLQLCIGQADEALQAIRQGRYIITQLVQFKKLNISGTGNKPNTRMCALFDQL